MRTVESLFNAARAIEIVKTVDDGAAVEFTISHGASLMANIIVDSAALIAAMADEAGLEVTVAPKPPTWKPGDVVEIAEGATVYFRHRSAWASFFGAPTLYDNQIDDLYRAGKVRVGKVTFE